MTNLKDSLDKDDIKNDDFYIYNIIGLYEKKGDDTYG